jgi:hypothetical protein
MKPIIAILLVSTLLLAACNNNKSKETTSKISSEEKGTNDPKQKAIQDIEKQKEELLKLSPLPAEQLKALIPETLMGANRTNHDVNSSIGANVASGDYELNDSAGFTLSIYDCSGPGGSGIYGMHVGSLLNDLHDNEQDYLKTIDYNGGKAFEQCDKINFDCTFSYFTGGRFLVTLEGAHVSMEELKQAAGGLNIR